MGLLSRLFGARYRTTAPEEAHRLVQEGAQFLDVRRRAEYKDGHARGARNLPLHTLPQQMPNLDSGQPVVLICRSGRRSASAARLLSRNGFTEVHSVTGGSASWRSRGLPWAD